MKLVENCDVATKELHSQLKIYPTVDNLCIEAAILDGRLTTDDLIYAY